MEIIVTLLIIAIIVYLCFWIVDSIPLAAPFNVIVKIVIGVLAVLKLLTYLS